MCVYVCVRVCEWRHLTNACECEIIVVIIEAVD